MSSQLKSSFLNQDFMHKLVCANMHLKINLQLLISQFEMKQNSAKEL